MLSPPLLCASQALEDPKTPGVEEDEGRNSAVISLGQLKRKGTEKLSTKINMQFNVSDIPC